jgi:DNA polymerase-1
MLRILADLETDNLLDKVTRIHCLMAQDIDDPFEEIRCYHDDPTILPHHGTLKEGIAWLKTADLLYGHNWTDYDDQVLVKLGPTHGFSWSETPSSKVLDTVVESRLIASDRKEKDFSLQKARRMDAVPFPGRYIGSHGLAAWGARLGEAKGEFSDFSVFTEDMLHYGMQDIRTNRRLLDYLLPRSPAYSYEGTTTSQVEQFFSQVMTRQQTHGIRLDTKAGEELLLTLVSRRIELEALIQEEFPPLQVPYKRHKTTGKRARRLCPIRGEKHDNKLVPFNPGSRPQLAVRLERKHGWVPEEIHKKTGNPVMEERILLSLAEDYPEVGLIAEYLVVNSRISILQDSPRSYFKLAENGRLHGRTIHIGTLTHRVAHSSPNLGNVTSVSKPYGKELRAIFIADEGMEQAGFDAAGIQLRGLGHYLAKYDGGAYGLAVTQGTEEEGTDAHSLHARAISEATECSRTKGKGFTYAFLFGAQNAKLGRMAGGSKALGARIRASLTKNINGLGPLIDSLTKDGEQPSPLTRGWLLTPDKRRVGLRHKHAVLNTLLMSFEAAVMKWMLFYFYEELESRGIIPGVDYIQTGFIHDEVQGSLKPGLREPFQAAVTAAFARAQKALGIRVPIDGTAKFGRSWADTH